MEGCKDASDKKQSTYLRILNFGGKNDYWLSTEELDERSNTILMSAP